MKETAADAAAANGNANSYRLRAADAASAGAKPLQTRDFLTLLKARTAADAGRTAATAIAAGLAATAVSMSAATKIITTVNMHSAATAPANARGAALAAATREIIDHSSGETAFLSRLL